MGSNWLAVDNNFPSFTGEESPTQQIKALHNYLFCLKEQLQYSLNNLTADNWNADALQSLTDDAKSQLASGISSISNHLTQLQNQLNDLQKKVLKIDELDSRLTSAEESITYLEAGADNCNSQILQMQENIADHEQRLATQKEATEETSDRLAAFEADVISLDDKISGLTGIVEELQNELASLDGIVGAVIQQKDGTTTIGKDGAVLNLVGQVYLNGVLLEQGGTNETA